VNAGAKLVTVVGGALAVGLLVDMARRPFSPTRLVGAVLYIAGFALITVARAQLGEAFSLTPQARVLVTHGLYSRIRNPVYIFGMVAVLGIVLYWGQPRLLLMFAVLIPLQIVRARAEARVLKERFGDEYRRYKEQTWF